MDNRKMFLKGIAVGMVIFIAGNFLFTGLQNAYNRATFGGLVTSGRVRDMSPEQKIGEIMHVLDRYFVSELDREAMKEGMFTGLVYGVGDPYTTYMSRETLTAFFERSSGEYAGIGVVVATDPEDNRIQVRSVFPGSPGERAGLLIGDKIIRVNGFNVNGRAQEDAVSMIKGEPGTIVELTIFRELNRETFDVTVVRDRISVPTISHEMLEEGLGYIRISGFDEVTYGQFMTALNDLRQQDLRGLIIDVRNNPGGLLHTVVAITNELIPEGIIVYTEDKAGNREYAYSNSNHLDVPLVILVNEHSASASEVLSGAVRDSGTGRLVGTQTFGKGLVQSLIRLTDGSGLKVTTAKYFTPSGICINGEGLTPDYVVEMDNEKTVNLANLPRYEDIQLQKAIEVIQAAMGF